jgi:hypothetical protein
LGCADISDVGVGIGYLLFCKRERQWLVDLKSRRGKGTYDQIVDMIAIHQHKVLIQKKEEGRT